MNDRIVPRLEGRKHKAISQNIMGTPSMKFKAVLHDLRVVKSKNPTVVGLQEMKFTWYWAALGVFRPARWGKYPKGFRGAKSSQPIIWDRKVYKKITTRRILLHDGKKANPHGWEDRYITAVLLEDRQTGRRFWFTNRHYLPAAWRSPVGSFRRNVWEKANDRDRDFVGQLVRTGEPVFAVGDYNWPGEVYGNVLEGRMVDYHDWAAPIDKVISLNNENGRVHEISKSVIPESELNTDHGGRVLVFALLKNGH